MPTEGEKYLELVLLDDSNYESWCIFILNNIESFNPYLLSIVDSSICPPNITWANLSDEERKCLKLNAQAICLLTQSLSPNVEALILKEHGIPMDAHLLWKYIKEKFSETTTVQDSREADCLTKLVRPIVKTVRPVWLSQLAQDSSERSAIDQIKIQLLKPALCLLQVMGSALWPKVSKRRSPRGLRVNKKKKTKMILSLTS
jgi:hypothetical protein